MDAQEERRQALGAIASMIERSEKAQSAFAPGTAQHTLQRNRLRALCVAAALIEEALGEPAARRYTREDLEGAVAPLASLTRKCEKAQAKLAVHTWQHRMLESNLHALHLAAPLLEKALSP